MPKRKFNLSTYMKISGDEHIERRLRNQHEDEKNEINEALLEDYRATEPNDLTEKQLDKVRSGEATEVVEKRLDANNSKFANKFRNPSAYDGDINKLEEKRLLNNPVEDEKYEDASIVPNDLKWWEGQKSPDGLKLAKNNNIKKTAQFYESDDLDEDDEGVYDYSNDDPEELNFDKSKWDEISDEESSEPDISVEDDVIDFPIDDILEDAGSDTFEEMEFKKEDANGTPIFVGKIKVNTEVNEMNEEAIIRDALLFINDKHDIDVLKESLDLSNIVNGEIGYVGSPVEEFPISESEEEMSFASNYKEIKITSAQKKMMKK